MALDPYRKLTRSCRDCRWRLPDRDKDGEDPGSGHCAFNPPTLVALRYPDGWGGERNEIEAHQPWMQAHDWCGQWSAYNIIDFPKLEKTNVS